MDNIILYEFSCDNMDRRVCGLLSACSVFSTFFFLVLFLVWKNTKMYFHNSKLTLILSTRKTRYVDKIKQNHRNINMYVISILIWFIFDQLLWSY